MCGLLWLILICSLKKEFLIILNQRGHESFVQTVINV